jgi:transcriptional regulator GlxA family with amidase domain
MYQLRLKKERKQSVNLIKKLNRKIGTPRLSSEQPIGKAVEDDKTDSIGLQNKVMAYMEEEQRYLDSDFSLKPLAQEMQMTLREIEEKYQYLTGEPISEMRIRLRLKYACEQLENTDKKMEVIAEEAGFGSVRTFYRQFKTEYNMTPNVFRQVSKNE